MSVTIKTIAEKAGVSKATVSYVINNKPGVGAETRKKVLKIIDNLNYKPNSVARGLAGQSTEMIGLIIPDITDMFYADIIRGVELVANKLNYTINLCTTHGEESKEKQMLNYFSSGRVDGIILMVYGIDSIFLKKLKKENIPFVLIDYSNDYDDLCNVMIDNQWGGYKATDYLISLKHKKIAYIHGIKDNNDNKNRFIGFKKAMKENKIKINYDYIKYGGYTRKGGYQAAKELINIDNSPTAIFAANDQMAIGVINAIQEEGFSVPKDISVMGFDDIEASNLINPGLTTIRQPTYEMGKIAAQKIFSELKDDKICRESIFLKSKLVIRNSCSKLE